MERLKPRPPALFLGNGLNRAAGLDSWDSLLAALRASTGSTSLRGGKAFPLYYEQLYLEGRAGRSVGHEREVRRVIADHVGGIAPSALHDEALAVPVEHVLTTNYDPAIEQAADPDGDHRNAGSVREQSYSLFRHSHVGGRRVWQIHGSHRRPTSILLGHHQYVGYVNRIASYVQVGPEYKHLDDPRHLAARMADRKTPVHSWVDLLFCSDVHVLGFGFDPSEIHLWWLLGYIRRKQLGRDWDVPGRVTLWTHDGDDADRLDLLRAHGVEVEASAATPGPSEWVDFYRDRLGAIASRI